MPLVSDPYSGRIMVSGRGVRPPFKPLLWSQAQRTFLNCNKGEHDVCQVNIKW